MGLMRDCTLANRSESLEAQSELIEAQIVDISIIGLGVEIVSALPFKIGDELTVSVPDLRNYFSKAKLIYIEKDFDNTTRLGLKLYTSLKH